MHGTTVSTPIGRRSDVWRNSSDAWRRARSASRLFWACACCLLAAAAAGGHVEGEQRTSYRLLAAGSGDPATHSAGDGYRLVRQPAQAVLARGEAFALQAISGAVTGFCLCGEALFADGFESGTTSAWSAVVP
ncbi:MAG: hypothetical protein DWQ36_21185 [Acidobacteria bacterium]|nr:MAG: hypothetical protein DWQ30_09865 [Acidobacteriota bacterium]REK01025.1 MAG: hypothetical protein DWQ36_21185 [Acidobacteriota bacterium]